MAGVFKEIFASIILSLFYPDGAWLNELTSMDHMVDYNTINLAIVGADPDVVVDNAVWPLPIKQRTDAGVVIPLSTFDTVPTHITNVEELETAYDKATSVANQHAKSLQKKASMSAAYSIAPTADSATTPVLKTTGALNSSNTKSLTYDDILNLELKFNEVDLPQEGRVILLCPQHLRDLKAENAKAYKELMTDKQISGFKVYSYSQNPTYDPSTGKKLPYGAINGNCASIAFVNTEVMRAMGTIEGEPEKRFADFRGTLLGFQMRFVAMPFRNSGIAAIYSDAA